MAKKILIVEDSQDISEALKLLVEMRGYAAMTTDSGFEALRILTEERPDLILMDLALPDLNGDDVIQNIRSNPALVKVPILCVSSYTEGRRNELIAAGCNEVFSKSTFITSYASTLRRYLGE